MEEKPSLAPGRPGLKPTWTSGAKTGVGAPLSALNHCWFTLSHGIFNGIYYPRLDQACTRDMGLLITDGHDFFSEEKRDCHHEISRLAPDVPAYRLINTCNQGRYRIEKRILADPRRDVVLQWTRFTPLQGSLQDYHVYALLAPHIQNEGYDNTAWLDQYKGTPLLVAERDGRALALGCSTGWLKRSAGYVGTSDGWQDVSRHRAMTWTYERAEEGNVALTGEVDLQAGAGEFVLALGFGDSVSEAGLRTRLSLSEGFEKPARLYVQEWKDWLADIDPLEHPAKHHELYRISATVVRTHEAVEFPGAIIASLSVPWGEAREASKDLGGYHVVWPRDLAMAAGALLAVGAREDLRRCLTYLQGTQEADGHWPQCMWSDGRPYWEGIQMDEAAMPILLADLARRNNLIEESDRRRFWTTLRHAAKYITTRGPVTPQDRWENRAGFSPFTIAAEIAALLTAADWADTLGEQEVAQHLRDTADSWNGQIEHWCYVEGTELARRFGVDGYYILIAPPKYHDDRGPTPHKERPLRPGAPPASEIVSPDALALVRFGLRDPHDPRILNTIQVIDALLKVDTPNGPCWRRYNHDKYGEHQDGAPYDGSGIGRAWPLLTGERAHYELAAGRPDEALRLCEAVVGFANEGGMIPEQIWDSPDIPERQLFFGRPSGSAMPLVWAHAEYIKLLRSLKDGRVFDTPPQTAKRYLGKAVPEPEAVAV
jgi:glucoamylase